MEKQTFRKCTATHPDQPNRSGNARGRKIHLFEKGSKKTLCGMLVDERMTDERIKGTVFSWAGRDCKNCGFLSERRDYSFKDRVLGEPIKV